MSIDSIIQFLSLIFEVSFIDLLLSGDNAIVIALACRSLPTEQMKRAILVGTVAAIVMRVVLTMVSSFLLLIPGLKLVGGVVLLIIAIKLIIEEEEDCAEGECETRDLLSAIRIIIIADLAMSTDNVVALAAVAQGNFPVLLFGLALSIPLLMYGSIFVTRVINELPLLIRGGGALLGWLAGHLAIADLLFEQWIGTQGQFLPALVPILTAIFVLLQSRNIENEHFNREQEC